MLRGDDAGSNVVRAVQHTVCNMVGNMTSGMAADAGGDTDIHVSHQLRTQCELCYGG